MLCDEKVKVNVIVSIVTSVSEEHPLSPLEDSPTAQQQMDNFIHLMGKYTNVDNYIFPALYSINSF